MNDDRDAGDEKSELGRFLTSRRAQLQPADVGLRMYDERRRVPGLRREELAQLAGVSQAYYTRLEQGVSQGASAEVLDAIARALRLDETEREHLHDLAAGGRARTTARRTRKLGPEQLSDATRQLIASFGRTPVIVLGRRSDVLGWNRTGHALFAGHLDRESPEDLKHRPNFVVPKELGGPGGEQTNPEQLFASGYAACFHNGLRLIAAQRKLRLADSTVSATVGLLAIEDGRFSLEVALSAYLPGLTQAEADELVQATHQVCPYSNATRGNIEAVTITATV